jgi:hypothetical protein
MAGGEEVHVTAPASLHSVRPSEHFGDHCRQVDASSDQGRRSPVIECQAIPVAYVVEHAGDDPLLADAEVEFSRDSSLLPEFGQGFLEESHARHLPMEISEGYGGSVAHDPSSGCRLLSLSVPLAQNRWNRLNKPEAARWGGLWFGVSGRDGGI